MLANDVRNFLGVRNFLSVRNFFSVRIGCTEYLGCGEHFFLVSEIFFWCPEFLGGRNFWVSGIFGCPEFLRYPDVCACVYAACGLHDKKKP